MTDPMKAALWDGGLAVVRSLWGGTDYGYGRSAAKYSEDGSTVSMTVDTDKHQDDGTSLCYDIEVTLTKHISHSDGFWGPGGYIDKSKLDPQRIARIDNQHYFIEPDSDRGFQGMGGRQFTIIFNDGREVVTHNLWSQGTIPPKWRERHPDNATFKTAAHVKFPDGSSCWDADARANSVSSAAWDDLLRGDEY